MVLYKKSDQNTFKYSEITNGSAFTAQNLLFPPLLLIVDIINCAILGSVFDNNWLIYFFIYTSNS